MLRGAHRIPTSSRTRPALSGACRTSWQESATRTKCRRSRRRDRWQCAAASRTYRGRSSGARRCPSGRRPSPKLRPRSRPTDTRESRELKRRATEAWPGSQRCPTCSYGATIGIKPLPLVAARNGGKVAGRNSGSLPNDSHAGCDSGEDLDCTFEHVRGVCGRHNGPDTRLSLRHGGIADAGRVQTFAEEFA